VIWANEYDKTIWKTYESNHQSTILDRRSIIDINSEDVPDCEGIIGGPPCQSWSEAGALRGINDHRGQLFFDFIRMIRSKRPLFFLAENVSGMLASRNSEALNQIKQLFIDSGYKLSFKLLNASDYGVPQDRERVFFVGFRTDLNKTFEFPQAFESKLSLRDSIFDLKDNALAASGAKTIGNLCEVPNHEYLSGSFSTMFMSRNRVRSWDEQSFTIQAGGRHCPIHPQAPKMIRLGKDEHIFKPGEEHLYRRLTVREAARVQTYPDSFIFHYENVLDGYKMVGNSVPVKLAKVLAESIILQLK
jgi:DNA (cytosine-5)-methyltransferase 1